MRRGVLRDERQRIATPVNEERKNQVVKEEQEGRGEIGAGVGGGADPGGRVRGKLERTE